MVALDGISYVERDVDMEVRTDAAEAGVEAEEDDAQVGEHAPHDDQVVEVR